MRTVRLALLLCAVAVAGRALAQEPKMPPGHPPAKPAATSAADTDKALQAVGFTIAKQLEVFNLSPAELDKVVAAIRSGVSGKGKQQLDAASQQAIQSLVQSRLAVTAEKEKTKGAAYLAKAEKEKGATKTASGAIVIPIKEGMGAAPTANDTVKVHYTGTLVDGKEFDSSRTRGEPAQFPLSGVVKCWTEGLQKLKVGGRAKVVCPSDIAYGEQGRPPVIPGNAVLTFDVELLDIVKTPPAPTPPAPSK